MPTPSSGTSFLHELGQAYLEWDLMMSMAGYVGLRLMPPAPVALQAAAFPRVTLASMMRKVALDDLRRGPDGGYPRTKWEYEKDQYSTEEYGVEVPIDERLRRIAIPGGIPVEAISADLSWWYNAAALEQEIVNTVTDDTVLDSAAASVAWDDFPEDAIPLDDIKGQIEAFEEGVALPVNTVAMSLKQARNLLVCRQVQESLGRGRLTEGLEGEQLRQKWLQGRLAPVLAAVLGVPQVVIADGFVNNAQQGLAASPGRIWPSDKIAIMHIAPPGDITRPGFGRVINWTGDTGGMPIVVENYWSEEKRSEVIRARQDIHVKKIHSKLCRVLTGVGTAD